MQEWKIDFVSYNGEQTEWGRFSAGNNEGKRIDHVENLTIQNDREINDTYSLLLSAGIDNKRMARTADKGFGQHVDLNEKIYGGEVIARGDFEDHFVQLGVQTFVRQERFNYLLFWNPEDPNDPTNENWSAKRFIENEDVSAIGAVLSEKWTILPNLIFNGAIRAD